MQARYPYRVSSMERWKWRKSKKKKVNTTYVKMFANTVIDSCRRGNRCIAGYWSSEVTQYHYVDTAEIGSTYCH